MALDAVLEVADTLLLMFRAHVARRMFMASVAGIAAVILARVTRRTRRVVVAIQYEELGVVERRRLPPLRTMALLAISFDLTMPTIGRRGMTTLATLEHGGRKRGVLKVGGCPAPLRVT